MGFATTPSAACRSRRCCVGNSAVGPGTCVQREALARAGAEWLKKPVRRFTFSVRRDIQPSEYRSVGYWSKEINRTLIGGEKGNIFLFAVLKWSIAPVECCQFVVQRSPWGRLGSVLYVRNRLHRMHRCLGHIYQFSQQSSSLKHDLPMALIQSFGSFGMPEVHAHAV